MAILETALADPTIEDEAMGITRSLIEQITLMPHADGTPEVLLYANSRGVCSPAKPWSAQANAPAMAGRGVDCRWLRGRI